MQFGLTGTAFMVWILAWPAVGLFLFLAWWGNRRRRADLKRFGRIETLYRVFTPDIWRTTAGQSAAERENPARTVRMIRRALRHRKNLRLLLVILAVISLLVAAGRPQWGNRQEEIYQEGIDIVLAVDCSYSMEAEDVAPNRLEKARSEIGALLDQLDGNRIALIGFASTTRLHCPLTLDYRGMKSILDHSLSLGPGTNLENAVQTATLLLRNSEARSKAILLISDGEHLQGDVEAAVKAAREAGIRIFTLGVGTPEGGPIPEKTDSGTAAYKKRNGELVWTRLDEETLKTMAADTGGAYFRATATETEIPRLVNRINGLEKSEFSQTMTTRKEDRFGWFIFLAIILLSLEAVLGDFRRIRWEKADD